MENPAVSAKQLVDLARKRIQEQQCRIVSQRELMSKYERDDDVARLSGARLVLERMQKQLAQMTKAHVKSAAVLVQRSKNLRSAARDRASTDLRADSIGFRVARTLLAP